MADRRLILRKCLLLLAPILLSACDAQPESGDQDRLTGLGDPGIGKTAIQQYACITCHRIPGVVGPDTWVGPSLRHIGSRTYLAGVLPNTPDNMIAWLTDPKAVVPDTAMPDLGVTHVHARHIAAFLYRIE